jgi:pimeloyl-ACP methyl ester carboxylesterase
MADKSILYQDSVIHYKTMGNGLPVVLVHGFAEDSSIWDNHLDTLSKYGFLIIPDIPGSGRSAILKGTGISLEDYAECIKKIIAAESAGPVIMIGHSMGGYITLAFAERYPAMIRSAGLFHSSAYADDAEKIGVRKKAIVFIKENGPEAFLKTSLPGLFKDAEKSRDDLREILAKGKTFTGAALIQYYEAMIARPDRTEVLKALDIPFLFVMGEHDKAVPFQHSLQQTQLPTHSYVYILRNSAHMGMLEEKEKTAGILANFLHDLKE